MMGQHHYASTGTRILYVRQQLAIYPDLVDQSEPPLHQQWVNCIQMNYILSINKENEEKKKKFEDKAPVQSAYNR